MTERLLPEVMYFCLVSIGTLAKATVYSMNQQRKRPRQACAAANLYRSCRQVAGKRALIRLVRTEHGVVVDPDRQTSRTWPTSIPSGRAGRL